MVGHEAYAAGKVDGKNTWAAWRDTVREVRYCHAAGAVTGNEVGGLVGFNEGNVYGAYYDGTPPASRTLAK